jgi:hypothetical protein
MYFQVGHNRRVHVTPELVYVESLQLDGTWDSCGGDYEAMETLDAAVRLLHAKLLEACRELKYQARTGMSPDFDYEKEMTELTQEEQ